MIKKLGKATLFYAKKKSWNAYLKFYFNKQIKRDFLKKSDYLEIGYKNEINDYWEKFGLKINKDWHKWYSSRNNIYDVRYIPEDIFYSKILPYYNRIEMKKAYCDKALLGNIFPNIKQPSTLVKNLSGVNYDADMNILNEKEVLGICASKNKLYIKPSIDSGGGRGITIIEADDDKEMVEKVVKVLRLYKTNFVIQEEIIQHQILSEINDTSINTIRPISFFDGEKVHILSSILRMGINGAKVDSESSGGISCGIDNDGRLRRFAYDRYGNSFKKHPQGFVFENVKIPSFDKINDIIKREHLKFGHFKIISWDFAIDFIGDPILVEYNLGMQGINFHQMDNGPLFGELTRNVLIEVFDKDI